MVKTLQKLCERRIEKLVRKTTCQEKDPVTRSLASLTEEQQETAMKVMMIMMTMRERMIDDG